MIDCLQDYIGLQVCADQPVPPSGMYINTLPGISLESIDKIANADQITYIGVWQDVQREAAIRFKSGFMITINACHTLNRGCDYGDMICDNLEYLAEAWRYLLGNMLMIYRLNTTRLNRFTTVDAKQAAELRDYYAAEYEAAMQVAVKLVDVSMCCQIECNNNPQSVTWLP